MSKEIVFEAFPKQQEFIEAALSKAFTFIMFGGSIRGGKTYAGLGALILLCRFYPGSKWAIVRQDLPTLRRNTIPSWDKIKPDNFIDSHKQDTHVVKCKNGSEIIFFPENYSQDKDLDRWRGLEVNGFLLEEINELQEVSFNKAIERAGSHIIKNQPPPLILATCNPTQGWVKDRIYSKYKEGTLPQRWKYIPSKITDNPYNSNEYKENLKQLPAYEYKVFVEGDWDIQLKTGGEFWKAFEINKHVRPILIENTSIHISVDNNVHPYIAVSIWQVVGKEIRQVHELPCTDPENTVTAAAQKFIRWAKSINYADVIFIYGDQTSTSGNTIDENKKSFFTKFVETIETEYRTEKRMPSSNPAVALSGAFINAIFENNIFGLSITIGENCKTSINDYIMTKQDKDGKILKKRTTDRKTGISYEETGHCSDTMRYFICECFKGEYQDFQRGPMEGISRSYGNRRSAKY